VTGTRGRLVATIVARMASTRLPGKVLADLAGKPMLERLMERVARARTVDRIVVATTTSAGDEAVARLAARLGLGCYRGSDADVLGRVLEAARAFDADDVLALTGDNPLVDPELIDDVVAFFREGGYDYVTTTHMHHSAAWSAERTFPVGVSVQVFRMAVIEDAGARTDGPVVRGHASFAIYDHPERYRLGAFEAAGKYAGWRHPELRLTVDQPEDLALMREIFERLGDATPDFSTHEAIRLVAGDERLRGLNRHVAQRLVQHELSEAPQWDGGG
jgi:spore coat polysaccharide biosynthesis protein SpsF